MSPASPTHNSAIRLMSFMLAPLACWQLWIFPSIPYYHFQHLFAYPVCLYFMWLFATGYIRLADMYRRWRPFIPFALLVLVLQSVALWQNSLLPDTTPLLQRLLPMSIALCKTVLMWPMLGIVGEICLFTVQRPFALRASAYGYAYVSLPLLILCIIQGIAVYTAASSNSMLLALHESCAQLLRVISPYLEARWPNSVYNFYTQGAYSLSILRINGFFEEASALAGWIGTFFLPLSFGCIFVRNPRIPWLPLYGWISAIIWIILLFLLLSTTGQAIAIAALVLLLLFSLRGKAKAITGSLAVLCLSLCLVISLNVPSVGIYLQHRSQHWDMSTLPRVIIMLDSVDLIREHPLTGVGRGNFSAHIVQGMRYKAQVAYDEELTTWQKNKSVPPLSAILGFTAQYGIPLALLLLLGMARVCYTLYRQWRAQPNEPLAQFAFAACCAWYVLAGVAASASLDLRNPLFMLPLCTFIALAHWQKNLSAEAPHAP